MSFFNCFAPPTEGDKIKSEADALFKKNEWNPAIDRYKALCDHYHFFECPDNIERQDLKKRIFPSLVNLAECYKEIKNWQKVLQTTKIILGYDASHKKALFLQSMAQVQVGDFNGAFKNLKGKMTTN